MMDVYLLRYRRSLRDAFTEQYKLFIDKKNLWSRRNFIMCAIKFPFSQVVCEMDSILIIKWCQ